MLVHIRELSMSEVSCNKLSMMHYETPDWLQRTALLLGEEQVERLQRAHVLVVGLGGVGGVACEQLARAGVGHFTLVDHDRVDATNINRQIIAFSDTVGMPKVTLVADMLYRINPAVEIDSHDLFLEGEMIEQLLASHPFDFVLDCIDTLTPKCTLIVAAHSMKLPIISAMGAGAKLDPTAVSIAPIGSTSVCALARSVRRQLRLMDAPRSVEKIPCVFSTEPSRPSAIRTMERSEQHKRSVVGTVSYMPQLFGLHMAAYVIGALTK